MSEEGLTIKWTEETRRRVGEIVPRAEKCAYDLDAISEAHWRDYRHSHGEENVLRAERSSRRIRFLPDYDNNFTIEVVAEGGDLQHEACGTRLKLHDHFKATIAADPQFYGRAWCPSCRKALPYGQFRQLTAYHRLNQGD